VRSHFTAPGERAITNLDQTLEIIYIQSEETSVLRSIFTRLSAKSRELDHAFKGYTRAEIATITGVSTSAVNQSVQTIAHRISHLDLQTIMA
jgi:hypothetical protein